MGTAQSEVILVKGIGLNAALLQSSWVFYMIFPQYMDSYASSVITCASLCS